MVNNTPKITIKLFLQDKLKPELKEGKEYYPVYARITFLRRGTHLPMLNFAGRQIMFSRTNFSYFIDDFEKSGMNITEWWNGPAGDLISKEIILRKTIERAYEKDKEDIDFSQIVKSFRINEQSIHVAVHSKAKEISSKLLGSVEHPVAPNTLSDDVKVFMEMVIAVYSFLGYKGNQEMWKNKEFGYGRIPPSTSGTFYSWFFERWKEDFRQYLKDEVGNTLEFNSRANFWGLAWEFIKMFPVKKESIENYLRFLEQLISEVKEKLIVD